MSRLLEIDALHGSRVHHDQIVVAFRVLEQPLRDSPLFLALVSGDAEELALGELPTLGDLLQTIDPRLVLGEDDALLSSEIAVKQIQKRLFLRREFGREEFDWVGMSVQERDVIRDHLVQTHHRHQVVRFALALEDLPGFHVNDRWDFEGSRWNVVQQDLGCLLVQINVVIDRRETRQRLLDLSLRAAKEEGSHALAEVRYALVAQQDGLHTTLSDIDITVVAELFVEFTHATKRFETDGDGYRVEFLEVVLDGGGSERPNAARG